MSTFSEMAEAWIRANQSELSPEREPTKLPETPFVSFDGYVSEQTQNFSDRPPDAPDAWREDFKRWARVRCVHREGREDWGGVGCLWVDFCEWAISSDSVPCRRPTFERLLQDAGFRLKDGMAAGLLLQVDLEAALCFQAAPGDSGTPARAAVEKRRNVKAGSQPARSNDGIEEHPESLP